MSKKNTLRNLIILIVSVLVIIFLIFIFVKNKPISDGETLVSKCRDSLEDCARIATGHMTRWEITKIYSITDEENLTEFYDTPFTLAELKDNEPVVLAYLLVNDSEKVFSFVVICNSKGELLERNKQSLKCD